MSDHDRKCILITGAARRVGRALALDCVARGWRVAAHYSSATAEAESLRAEAGDSVWLIRADLSTPGAPARLVETTRARFGRLDALVNNAALFEYDRLGAFSEAVFDRNMALNLRAVLALTDAAARAGDGNFAVLTVLDQKIRNVSAANLSYTLSKIGLAAATAMQSRHLGALRPAARLRVNAIAPGLMLRSGRQTDADFAEMARDNPLGRAPAMAELVAAARFLLEADRISRQTIYVDSGLHLKGGERLI